MLIIDSHCHLNMVARHADLHEIIDNAKTDNVKGMLNVSVDMQTIDEVLQQTTLAPNIWASIGIHPCHCEPEQDNSKIRQQITKKLHHSSLHHSLHQSRIIAIGETGLDFFHQPKEKCTHQEDSFAMHIELAIEQQLPLIIHCRNAKTEVIETLQKYQADKCGGVMHCFAEDYPTAKAALDLGFYISFSGILTYPKSTELREVAKQIPFDRLLVETDSPYLAPVPHRSKKNQPQFVKHTLQQLAEIHQQPIEKMAQITTENFLKCFNTHLQEE